MPRNVSGCALRMCCTWILWAVACDWQPVARPVQPERLLEGTYRIEGVIDPAYQYVLVRRREVENNRFAIVDLRRRVACDLPESVEQAGVVLAAPTDDAKDRGPLLSLVADDGENNSALYVTDTACHVQGPFGPVGTGPYAITADADKRGLLLWGGSLSREGRSEVWLRDPWAKRQLRIARGVSRFSQVTRPSKNDRPQGAQALWLIEDGKLTQRTLDGELVVQRGRNVTSYAQATYDTVRVAFVDGGDLYEAGGPEFNPVLIAKDACAPFYYSTTLNLFSPCAARQLVRLELTTGGVELFEPGVFWSFREGGLLLEYAQQDGQGEQLLVTIDGERVRVEPTLYKLQVLGPELLAGLAQDRSFGVWTPRGGYRPLFRDVENLSPFIDVREGAFLWLMLHEEKKGVGRLSLLSQADFSLEDLAFDVRADAYSVEYLNQVPEPVVVSVQNAGASSDGGIRGELHARLLSGELASKVDDDVSSYTTIALPLPGLLYTIDEGPRRGLWFAAL